MVRILTKNLKKLDSQECLLLKFRMNVEISEDEVRFLALLGFDWHLSEQRKSA